MPRTTGDESCTIALNLGTPNHEKVNALPAGDVQRCMAEKATWPGGALCNHRSASWRLCDEFLILLDVRIIGRSQVSTQREQPCPEADCVPIVISRWQTILNVVTASIGVRDIRTRTPRNWRGRTQDGTRTVPPRSLGDNGDSLGFRPSRQNPTQPWVDPLPMFPLYRQRGRASGIQIHKIAVMPDGTLTHEILQ